MHFLLKVRTLLALITTNKTNQNKINTNKQNPTTTKKPTNLKRAKEVLKVKKKFKKYYFPTKIFLNMRTSKHFYNSQNIDQNFKETLQTTTVMLILPLNRRKHSLKYFLFSKQIMTKPSAHIKIKIKTCFPAV